MLMLEKYSIGTGDRFAHQGKALLSAVKQAYQNDDLNLSIVWNKSHREHMIINTTPASVQLEADKAVKALGWKGSYFVDADHIGIDNVDLFMDASNFFTIDVADYAGESARNEDIVSFTEKHKRFCGVLEVPGIPEPLRITEEKIIRSAEGYLLAVKEAAKIYRYIESRKGKGNFITEISMDEADESQSAEELLLILAAIADEKIPVQTIAPKFTGRFNKGVDFVGDIDRFNKEFEEDVFIIRYGVKNFGLAENLKLSVHSGSDKFSIYPGINRTLKKYNAGVHVKTAGTTWLEELVGLSKSGEEGLSIVKEIYCRALDRIDELCGPYANVIDIDEFMLPSKEAVEEWNGKAFSDALKHNQACTAYNPNFRQLLHVGYKIAAEMGTKFTDALKNYENTIAPLVTENIYERHIKPIFK